MKRAELIEIIYQYKKESQSLSEENARLNRELDDRRIKIGTAGSIAQAALSLNNVFEAAQNAADQYLSSVKELVASEGADNYQLIDEAQRKAREIEEQGRKRYDELVKQGEEKYRELLDRAKNDCIQMKQLVIDALVSDENVNRLIAQRKRSKSETIQ